MNKGTVVSVVSIVGLLSAGPMLITCGSDDDDKIPMSQIGPGAFAIDYASSGEFFTNMKGLLDGSSPHGKVRIWYSKNVQDLIAKDSFVVPQGTVSIKQFDADKDDKIDGLAVMIKQAEGYDTPNNNWYYAMYSVDGTLLDTPAAGIIQGCISCHANWSQKDYLGGTDLE